MLQNRIVAVSMLLALVVVVPASSPFYRGGVIVVVDEEGKRFVVEDCMLLGYDGGTDPRAVVERRTISYSPVTLFLLDGEPVTAAEALQPGRLLRCAFVKNNGFVEVLTTDSPIMDLGQAELAVHCWQQSPGERSHGEYAMRLFVRDGELVRAHMRPDCGGRPGIFGQATAVDCAGLHLDAGRLHGSIAIPGSGESTTLSIDAVVAHAALRGTATWTGADGTRITGYMVGGFDYPIKHDRPMRALTVLQPGWDGGDGGSGPLLLTLTTPPGEATRAELVPYGIQGEVRASIDVSQIRNGCFGDIVLTIAEGGIGTPGSYRIWMGDGRGSMGAACAIGTAYLATSCRLRTSSGKRKVTPGVLVLNQRSTVATR